MQFLDFFDFLTNSVMMPIAAIATCLLVSRVIGVDKIEQEVELDGQPFRRKRIFRFMIRWLCPVFAASFWQARWPMRLESLKCDRKGPFPGVETVPFLFY